MNIDCGICRIRPWEPGDRLALVRHANNPKVAGQLRDRFPHPYTGVDADAWLSVVNARQPVTNFAVEHDGEAVGGVGLELHDDVERCSGEVGYWLGESAWGKGIAVAALRGFTDHAFTQFGLTRIYAVPFAGNHRSRRVLEKAGFELEGILRRSVIKQGIVHDAAMYARVR